MKKTKNGYKISPQDILKYLDSPYATYKDRAMLKLQKELTMNIPGLDEASSEKEGTKNELQEALFAEGNEFEAEIVNRIVQSLDPKDYIIFERSTSAKTSSWLDETTRAMKEGKQYIFQAYLEDDTLYGFADILEKKPGNSLLGDYHYVVKDIKRSQVPKAKFVLQILCYCAILEKIQGVLPEFAYIILGNGEEESFKIRDYLSYFKAVKTNLMSFLNNQNEEPFPDKNKNHGNWKDEAKKFLEEKQDISLLPDISPDIVKSLRDVNINSIPELRASETSSLPIEILQRLKIQSQAFVEKKEPKSYLIYPHSNINPKGLNNLPKKGSKDIYLDIRYSENLSKKGFIFLITLLHWVGSKMEFKYYLIEHPEQEEEKLRELLDLLESKKDEEGKFQGTIFYYGESVLNSLIKTCSYYDLKISFLNELVFWDKLIDLQKMTMQSLALGVESFSIENICKHIDDAKNMPSDNEAVLLSIKLYSQKAELKKEAEEKLSRANLQKRVNVINSLHKWLLEVQQDNKELEFISFENREIGIFNELKSKSKDNTKEKETEEEKPTMANFEYSEKQYKQASTEDKMTTLVKQFGKYHAHEKFPAAIKKKQLLSTDDAYLNSDPLTLSNLELIEYNEDLFTYTFPKQESKLDEGDTVLLKQNSSLTANIFSVDLENRKVVLKYAKKWSEFAQRYTNISIIINNHIPDKSLVEKIMKNIIDMDKSKPYYGLNKAVHDFLLRKYPDINGINSGEDLYTEDDDLILAATKVVNNMNNTALIFQGPPGAGKTYTISQIIKDLIKNNKKIAISSNSHKAINNVLLKIKETCPEAKILKIQSEIDESLVKANIKIMDKKTDIKEFSIIGGTVWAFAKTNYDNFFDYLFVDEAGQVSLANLFAMGNSSKNIILIGDQMQLEQPTQALHPGDSGLSILEYFLNEYKTIPKKYGFFLPITRRMNPSLTKVISDNFYEGKLLSHESTNDNSLVLNNHRLITKDRGLQFVPVAHEGNIQYSYEEIAKIKDLVAELLTQEVKLNGVIRKVELSDIIFVSPYNLQVKKIQEAIPGANAGSVDLFQGQEAPIVIISLASSASGGRGLDFLLSENRLNVAISRGKCVAILIANPGLVNASASTLEELKLLNLFCNLTE